MSFKWPVTVFYEDTDAGGIVYHANYLCFMERARTQWLKSLGFKQQELRLQDVLFVVSKLAIDYHTPARLDDELYVTVTVTKARKVAMTIRQQVINSAAPEHVLASADVEIACVTQAGKPRKMPETLLKLLEQQ